MSSPGSLRALAGTHQTFNEARAYSVLGKQLTSHSAFDRRIMSKKSIVSFSLALLCTTASLHAQRGCHRSPEAPTDVLLLVGSIGTIFGSSFVMKAIRKIAAK